jgi:hypothetical protein
MHMTDSPKDHTDILGSEHGIMPMMGGDGWV